MNETQKTVIKDSIVAFLEIIKGALVQIPEINNHTEFFVNIVHTTIDERFDRNAFQIAAESLKEDNPLLSNTLINLFEVARCDGEAYDKLKLENIGGQVDKKEVMLFASNIIEDINQKIFKISIAYDKEGKLPITEFDKELDKLITSLSDAEVSDIACVPVNATNFQRNATATPSNNTPSRSK